MNTKSVYIIQHRITCCSLQIYKRADTGSKKSRHVSKNKAQKPQECFPRTVEEQGKR
jgi:hypothetical protein